MTRSALLRRWPIPAHPKALEKIAQQVAIALEAADLSAFGELLDPDVHWGAPDDPSPACQGRSQVLAWYQRGREAGVRARVSEVVVLGDRVILVGLRVVNQAATKDDSEVERWQILTVGGSRVVDIVGFDNRSEAVARARQSLDPGDRKSVPRWSEPPRDLADDRIGLRLPHRADAAVLHAYASEGGGLRGVWVPLTEGASLQSCEALVVDWLAGWRSQPSLQGPALFIVEAGQTRLVGHVGFRDRGDKVVELVYGVAPDRRGRGYASRAARLVASWLLADGLAREVELRIDRSNVESQRVAQAAGFAPAGTVLSHVEATGDTYDDLRFVMPAA
jgi:RimJ/RimL family protein N-acetyltransferase